MPSLPRPFRQQSPSSLRPVQQAKKTTAGIALFPDLRAPVRPAALHAGRVGGLADSGPNHAFSTPRVLTGEAGIAHLP